MNMAKVDSPNKPDNSWVENKRVHTDKIPSLVSESKFGDNTNALLSAIIENSDDAIISKNLDGTITSWNTSAEHIFGYKADEILGQPVTVLIPRDRLKEETDILEKLKQGDRVDHLETVRLRKDGKPLNVSLTISPIYDSSGQLAGASKIARDITERKKTEAKVQAMKETLEDRVNERTAALLSYQKQLKSLTSELSKAEDNERQRLATELHDNLGQILAISKMKLNLLMRNPLPDPAHSQVVELIGLINNAINFTREQMADLKPPPSSAKDSLAANIGWVVKKMKKHNLNVAVEDDNQPKVLSEDVHRVLCQCVRELLFNVIKHAGVSEARIKISRVGQNVQVSVADEGKGFKVNNSRPEPTKSGGFGLFNIHERIDWLGGSMEIDTKPGEGTNITLSVSSSDVSTFETAVSDHDPGLSLPEPMEKDNYEKRVKVLLVDDHQMVRAGLKNLIEENQDLIVIAEATNGREAVEQAHRMDPDIIVMDVNMPVMDGIEATQIISSSNLNVRIIGLSFHDKEDVKDAMKRAGASAYLTKTEAFESLSAIIRSEAMVAGSN